MIPRDYITEWRAEAPWIEDAQVEQDLVISRALVEIFTNPVLKNALAFRGGTALYKLFLKPAARYSEDIDLVQVSAEPAGAVMDALRDVLTPWLGEPRYRQSEGRVTFRYRFSSEDAPPLPLTLKVEINTREHFAVGGLRDIPFAVRSRWFEGDCAIPSYGLNELLGTKLRALYQRRKGRDLFDLAIALDHPDSDPDRIVAAFTAYMDHGGHNVTRTEFAENLAAKMRNRLFAADIGPLLRDGYEWDLAVMADKVSDTLIARLSDQA
ncbi:MAG: nucleotidyl transferase AbiEii/AbiGii toxin family protein [Hyphomicrobiales bacterium]|nr:nucleotidyl transferase AbiEii/AbiGii toxin family protein [Hyphomicrobiales bacterium]MCP5372033.1 nucleotidyl transferase AbiEii/AbiGii toxin family protein [Hyphomicrobiales bacterium]